MADRFGTGTQERRGVGAHASGAPATSHSVEAAPQGTGDVQRMLDSMGLKGLWQWTVVCPMSLQRKHLVGFSTLHRDMVCGEAVTNKIFGDWLGGSSRVTTGLRLPTLGTTTVHFVPTVVGCLLDDLQTCTTRTWVTRSDCGDEASRGR